MATEPDRITCFEITHDGEGEPGRSIEVIRTHAIISARHAAEEAAREFDNREKVEFGTSDSDLNGISRVIEVRGFGAEPNRFRVWTRVERRYESTTEETP